ncbi:L,D-transpeptidase [Ferruginibacter lapsinanis]|uniref:L,D-transpeptidase n=1 Tax=Ferruginibacter lapsinanis TaxID=563172 RepID=UPI001E58CD63|nr:L,D-transpeptidase [Ferruginibacter lapsinanis]UEG49542.1 L,D-transpeptidase [Ferruginibacter lapsinanis]
MRKIYPILQLVFLTLLLSHCNQPVTNDVQIQPQAQRKRVEPKNVGYHIEKRKEWIKNNAADSLKQRVVLAVNRVDVKHLALMDTIIVPNDFTGDYDSYLPFPASVPSIKDIKKILFFSYPTQVFAAYEMGELVYTGPVSMGRKNDQTPTGLYFTNWKAEKTTSTFNDEWDLRWNFNIENKLGIGFHQYDLPGYPASHSCLRLLEKDAIYLYSWADQWEMDKKNKDSVSIKGTPVIVFGSYPFGSPKPWLQLVTDPHALDMPATSVESLTAPFLQSIMAEQQKRTSIATTN